MYLVRCSKYTGHADGSLGRSIVTREAGRYSDELMHVRQRRGRCRSATKICLKRVAVAWVLFVKLGKFFTDLPPSITLQPSSHTSTSTSKSATPSVNSGTVAASYDMEMLQGARDITPWEPVACEKLTEQILSFSAATATPPAGPSAHFQRLDQAIRDATITIRYNAKWFAEAPLSTLLNASLDVAATSSSSADIYAAIDLIDTIGTYSLLPSHSLQRTVEFIAQTCYNATRANKTMKLATAAWTSLHNILKSHLGGQSVVALLQILDCRDSAHLESRIGYAQTAGTLMIVSRKMLLQEDVRKTVPMPGLTQLLDNLRGLAVNGDANLRELMLELIADILTDDYTIGELDALKSWDSLLVAVEPCVVYQRELKRSKFVVQALVQHVEHMIENKIHDQYLSMVALMAVEFGLPLPKVLSDKIVGAWSKLLSPKSDMPNELTELLTRLSKAPLYFRELRLVTSRATEDVFASDRHALETFVGTIQGLAIDQKETGKEAADLFAHAVARMMLYILQHPANNRESCLLFDASCQISVRCTAAAEPLFRLYADAEGTYYLEKRLSDDRPPMALYNVESLPLWKWDDVVLSVVRGSTDWELYDFFLTSLQRQIGNHTMFRKRPKFVKLLRDLICDTLATGSYPEPPSSTGLAKSHVTAQLLEILTAVLSYHHCFSKQEIVSVISTFTSIAGSRDSVASIPCVHALTVCCYELPDLMSSYMDDVIDKMSKMVTQRDLAIHVLAFLAGLSRLPDLFHNFQGHDYKKIFGVCVSYLQSIRSSDTPLDSSSDRASSSSANKTIVPPHYVYALAHHVIAFWYTTIKPEHRQVLKEFILTALDTEGQGLVTVDLMDAVDAEEAIIDYDRSVDRSHGRTVVQHRIAGVLLITTETVLRTGKTVVNTRRPSSTSTRILECSSSVAVTSENTKNIHFNVFPFDEDGRTYGRILIPSPDSILGSSRTLTIPQDDDSITRAIDAFDRTSALDSHKAGVIYIGEGQTTEDDIFRNAMGSPDYVELVQGLGSLMRLKGATFNTQGLDRFDDTDGQHAIVWHNEIAELVFHVTTLMPTNEDVLLNTANKKRHIGNDHVNIVFNNSGSTFDFDTFPSAFSSVYIVITPSARTSFLQTRMTKMDTDKSDRFYRVRVLTRPGYPDISSAAQEKIISGASLPGYVRNLALNDCVFSLMWSQRDETGEYPSSWRSRLDQIRRLRDRYE